MTLLKHFSLLLLLLSSGLCAGQSKVFLTANYENTTEDKAVLYAINNKDASMNLIKVERFYLDNNQLESKGYLEIDGKKSGTWQWFYPNGNPEKTVTYSLGRAMGMQMYYFPDSKLKEAFSFHKTRKTEMPFNFDYYATNGQVVQIKDGNGIYNGPYIGFFRKRD